MQGPLGGMPLLSLLSQPPHLHLFSLASGSGTRSLSFLRLFQEGNPHPHHVFLGIGSTSTSRVTKVHRLGMLPTDPQAHFPRLLNLLTTPPALCMVTSTFSLSWSIPTCPGQPQPEVSSAVKSNVELPNTAQPVLSQVVPNASRPNGPANAPLVSFNKVTYPLFCQRVSSPFKP